MSLCAGLVVAVQDHEHFRLKLVYSRKKKIQNSLRETEVKLQLFRVCPHTSLVFSVCVCMYVCVSVCGSMHLHICVSLVFVIPPEA